jgi:dethiobiotin synthetase
MDGKVIAISGIDTDIGKTWATGLLAKALIQNGQKIMTQKMVQTGCDKIAEDILTHRKLMDIPLQAIDLDGTTCPMVYSYPASPHLAAEIDKRPLDPEIITEATLKLRKSYDLLLLEGAGGLMVPLTHELMLIDYLQEQNYPLILVTSPRLGSINHTLLSLEACRTRGIEVLAVLYNCYPEKNGLICDDTRKMLKLLMPRYGCDGPLIDLPAVGRDEEEGFVAAVAALKLL